MSITVMIVLCGVIVFQWIDKYISVTRLEEANYNLCEQWIAERKELLDRIQAPSFDHLKAAEVRVIKAQKEEKPIERVELL